MPNPMEIAQDLVDTASDLNSLMTYQRTHEGIVTKYMVTLSTTLLRKTNNLVVILDTSAREINKRLDSLEINLQRIEDLQKIRKDYRMNIRTKIVYGLGVLGLILTVAGAFSLTPNLMWAGIFLYGLCVLGIVIRLPREP